MQKSPVQGELKFRPDCSCDQVIFIGQATGTRAPRTVPAEVTRLRQRVQKGG
jgi:hypothetical protein